MKKEFSAMPSSMANMAMYGFSWMDFVNPIPTPLFVITSYKSNGKPNACLQSWSCFSGNTKGYYAFMSNIDKDGHFYQTVKEKGEVVINFPTADIYDLCMATIKNNDFDTDEITASGLTSETATTVNAPRIKECFLALEGRFLWEREITEGRCDTILCFQITNICIDEAYLAENGKERSGENGFIYYMPNPVNPNSFKGQRHDYIGILQKHIDLGEY